MLGFYYVSFFFVGVTFPDGTPYINNPAKYYHIKTGNTGYTGGTVLVLIKLTKFAVVFYIISSLFAKLKTLYIVWRLMRR